MKTNISLNRIRIYILTIFVGITLLSSYTDPCFAQETANGDSYKTLIKQADQAFLAHEYKGALKLYEDANKIEPEYNYPVNKIEEIKKILNPEPGSKVKAPAKSKNSNDTYKTFIAQADHALSDEDYATALLFYEKASQTKPDYNYAPGKIDEINSILNSTSDSKTLLFKSTMLKAENYYGQKNYELAKPEYQKALLIDSAAQLPKDRLKQINSIYVDPGDMANYNLALANGDKALAGSDFDHAVLFYEAALAVHPNSKYVKGKITETKKQQLNYVKPTEQPATNIASAAKQPQTVKPVEATKPKETIELAKTDESQLKPEQGKNAVVLAAVATTATTNATATAKETDNNYSKYITEADKQFNENKFQDAIVSYTKALGIKPAEAYPQQKITEAQGKMLAAKSKEENYASAIASGDRLLAELKYNEALNLYKQALTIKPNEAYPIGKTAEINSILAKQKSDSDNYAQAIRAGEKALAAGNLSLALTSFQDAQKIKPSEKYPMEQITEIKAVTAKQKSDSDNYAQAIRTGEKALAAGNLSLALTSFQDAQKIKPSEKYPMEQITEIKAVTAKQLKNDEQYANDIKTGDQLFAKKEYSSALTSYTKAAELKKNEKYPQDQIVKINKMLADSRPAVDNYALLIAKGDSLFGIKDYADALSSYTKASGIKPAESYPKQRIIETNKIIEGTKQASTSEYKDAIAAADKLYSNKVYDKAIDAYESASKINPGDSYPEVQISKIRKYLSDHAILNLYSQALLISRGNEKKFTFATIDPSLRKNNYILLNARSIGSGVPKVYLNYGKDDQKNGGIVIRNLDKTKTLSDFLISISIQDKWFREENNWISISVETGEIEITKVQISAGD